MAKDYYSAIVAFDIKSYSKSTSAQEMALKRETLRQAIKYAVDEYSDIQLQDPIIEAGDGLIAAANTTLISVFIPFMIAVGNAVKLLNTNYIEKIKVRAVVHFGTYQITNHIEAHKLSGENVKTLIGSGINQTSRYINCKPLKKYLDDSLDETDFVFGVSLEFAKMINKNDQYIYHLFEEKFQEKEFCSSIFLYKPESKNKQEQIIEGEEFNELHNEGLFSSSLIANLIESIEKMYHTQEKVFRTGYYYLDQVSGGMFPGRLWLVLGQENSFKTTISLKLISNLIRESESRKNIALFFGDCLYEDIMYHFTALDSDIKERILRQGLLKPSEFHKLTESAGRIYESEIFFYDLTDENDKLKKTISLIEEKKIRFLFIDNVSYIEKCNQILRALKEIAVKNNVFILYTHKTNEQYMNENYSDLQINLINDVSENDLNVVVNRSNYGNLFSFKFRKDERNLIYDDT